MNQEINDMYSLQQRIEELENEVAIKTKTVKYCAAALKESIKPSSLIRNVVQEITGSHSLKQNVVDTALSVGSGWMARKLFTFNSKSTIKSILGYGLQHIITAVVASKLPQLREQLVND